MKRPFESPGSHFCINRWNFVAMNNLCFVENSMSQSRMCDSDIGKSLDDLSKRQKLLEEALDEEKFAVSRYLFRIDLNVWYELLNE